MSRPTTSIGVKPLSPTLAVGLLVFRADGGLDFADGRARALFGCKEIREVEERLNGVRPTLTSNSPPPGPVDVETMVGGQPRSLRVNLTRVGEKGSDCFVGMVTDGDALHALETDLRFAAHLRTLSRVSYATAHDIRTPLHTMVLYLELLRSTLSEKPDANPAERQERYVDVIGSELQRLEVMMESLFRETRVTDERVEQFDLHEAVNQLREFLEPYSRKTRVTMHLTPADTPVVVQANRDTVRHALLPILVRSLEVASREGSVGNLSISVTAADGGAVVSVTGDLSGLPRVILDDEPGPEQVLGAERGLVAARRAVESLGGGIKIQSGAQSAATLEINLPLAAAKIG